jgi:hypothetical protein
VAEEIEALLADVEEAAQTSTLRDIADQEFTDSLVLGIYREKVKNDSSR